MSGAQIDYAAQERAALVTFLVVTGAELTTAEIAERVGITPRGALLIMDKISRVVPVYQYGGRWRILHQHISME